MLIVFVSVLMDLEDYRTISALLMRVLYAVYLSEYLMANT